jgi:anti-sigma-K factor RskA
MNLRCADVDELAAAYALGAVEPDEERAISDHLATCDDAHAEARELIGAAPGLAVAVEPVTPSASLRARLMTTIADTPQAHRPAPATPAPRIVAEPPGRPWWRLAPLPAGLAAVGLAAVIGLGAWNVNLNQRLADRDAALRAVASADAAYAVTGSAGSGWVLETDGRAIFLADSLAALPADRIYELWLLGPDGDPVDVGTLASTEGLALVELERELGPATTFAVTIEAERVGSPTSEPVLVAALEG